jgi:hypothetical protein
MCELSELSTSGPEGQWLLGMDVRANARCGEVARTYPALEFSRRYLRAASMAGLGGRFRPSRGQSGETGRYLCLRTTDWLTSRLEGVKKLATARGCCGFGNTDKLQA